MGDVDLVLTGTAVTVAVLAGWAMGRGRGPVRARELRRLLRSNRPGADTGRSWSTGTPQRSDPPPLKRAPVTDEVASAMMLLAVALQSGCGVVEAIEQVASEDVDPARRDLAVVAAAIRWGVGDRQAWSVVGPAWSRTAVALRLASASGVAPSTLLSEGADDLRAAQLAEVDVAAARVGVRLVLPLGLAFLPAFVLTTVVPVVLALARHVLET